MRKASPVVPQWELRCPSARTDQWFPRRSPAKSARLDPLQTPSLILVTALSGCFSNQHGQQPLQVEVLDAKRFLHRAFARPAARGRDREEMRERDSGLYAPQNPAIPTAALQVSALKGASNH